MPITAASLMVLIGANTGPAEVGIGKVAGMLSPGGMLAVGAIGAAAVVAGIGVASLKMAGDFQAGMVSIVTGAGESRANLKMISDGVLSLATTTGTSTDQLTAGLYMIESGGFHGAAGLAILKNAAEGAKVGNADLGVVADATDTILKNFGEHGMTSAAAVNTLIVTVANGKTHLQDLSEALAHVLPTAAAAGIGLNDTMAAMATMTSIGVPAADAATYLRQTIIALEAPSHGTAKALKAVGLTTTQVADEMHKSMPGALKMITDAVGKQFPEGSAGYIAALKNIAGGSKQMQGILDLTGSHMKVFQEDVGKISGAVKAGGNSIVGWSDVQGTFNQKMSVAGEVVKTLMIQMGEKLLPVASDLATLFAEKMPGAISAVGSGITNVVTVGTNLVKFFQDTGPAATAVKGILVVLGGAMLGFAASAIPAAVVAIMASVTAFGVQAVAAGAAAIATMAAALPFILIGAAIALVVVGIYELIQHWGQVSAFFGKVGAIVGATAQSIMHAVGGFFSGVGSTVQAGISFVKGLIQAGFTFITGTLWTGIQGAFSAGLGAVKGLIQAGFTLIKDIIFADIFLIVDIFNWLYQHNTYFADLVNVIKADFLFAKSMIGIIWTDIKTFLVTAWNDIVGLATAVFGFVKGVIITEFNFYKAIITTVWQDVAGFLTATWDTIRAVFTVALDFIKGVIIADFNFYADIIRTVGGAILATIQSAWDNVTTFIGGLASVIGGAVHSGVVTPLMNEVTGLIGLAESWGGALIQMFIKGISAQAGALKTAAGNVLGGLGKILGFHSPAEEGPGADADTWAPNLMKMFTGGIAAAAPAAIQAASGVLAGVAGALTGANMGGVRAGGLLSPNATISQLALSPVAQLAQSVDAGMRGGSLPGGTSIIIPISIAGRQVAQALLPDLAQAIRHGTGARG